MKQEFRIAGELWEDIDRAFGDVGGVYKLFCRVGNKRKSISRLLASDESGILYIGKADSFKDRVINLKKSISPKHKSSSHECGVRYKSSDQIKAQFPYEQLWLELTHSDDANKLEKEELSTYEKQFGELPPFNRVV